MEIINHDSRFKINDFIIESRLKNQQKQLSNVQIKDFKSLIHLFDKESQKELQAMTDEEKNKELDMQHRAIIGDPSAVMYMKDKIQSFLNKHVTTVVQYPQYYKNLTEAIFHDRFGLGPLSTWSDYPHSQAAQIIGVDIYFLTDKGKELQPFKFESIDRVYELCNALTMKDSLARINESQPTLEIDMYDGTRVTISIPPRTQVPVLTFRRHVVRLFSLEYQAKKKTIPEEAIPLFRSLAKTRTNIIFSGPVRSGKSTMLKTFFAERNEMDTVVCIEKNNFELFLRRDFPNRPVIEMRGTEEELLHEVFPITLRQDVTYYIVAEIRGIEAELYLAGGERGSSGCMGTYHTTFAVNIPGLIARHIVDVFPSRSYRQELIRAAEVIDYVITMEELDDQVSKKVTSVQEVRLDPFTHEVSTVTIMQYDFDKDEWFYHDSIDERLYKKMRKYDKNAAEEFRNTLSQLARKKPIQGEVKQISLESRSF